MLKLIKRFLQFFILVSFIYGLLSIFLFEIFYSFLFVIIFTFSIPLYTYGIITDDIYKLKGGKK